ncbi:MAG TPA: AmmeMemoRadiSam system radical SAM enzyme [Sediminispirochaeta sp.]|nr:AmmeMemoRadiSam system radical SAM enzyme [Sediminispirochaeta sp.]
MAYTYQRKGRLECLLCPHHCRLSEGEVGICKVRENRQGQLSLPYYGVLSAVANDPIEKKPLYHFYPGSSILSVGFYGCSFHCPFCQNYQIAQYTPERVEGRVEPEELVRQALSQDTKSIAYTYSEPTVHFEWVMETARIARSKGLKNVLVSNGYLNPQPAAELLEVMDAANIDLKSFREEFYRNVVGGHLAPVLAFIRQAAASLHLEVTTLIIPAYNDTEAEMREISSFLAELDPNIPLHLSRYYPAYRFDAPPTKADSIFALRKVARQRLNYVYPGNVGSQEVTTYCPGCGAALITRRGYRVENRGIKDGSCLACGRPVDFPV